MWRVGNEPMRLYKYEGVGRVIGEKGRVLKHGELCLCVEHAGDCYDRYIVIRKHKDGYKKAFRFSTYVFGAKRKKLTERKFYLLLAGETVKI